MVKVSNAKLKKVTLWNPEKFESRLEQMRELYQVQTKWSQTCTVCNEYSVMCVCVCVCVCVVCVLCVMCVMCVMCVCVINVYNVLTILFSVCTCNIPCCCL